MSTKRKATQLSEAEIHIHVDKAIDRNALIDNLVKGLAKVQVDIEKMAARAAEFDVPAGDSLDLDAEENRIVGEWLTLQERSGLLQIDTRVAAFVREGIRFALKDFAN